MHLTIAQPMPATRPPDDIDLDVLAGIVADMRTQAGFLVKSLLRNQHIDRDVWQALRDIAAHVLDDSELVLCAACLREQKTRIGRSQGEGRGFEECLCREHEREVWR